MTTDAAIAPRPVDLLPRFVQGRSTGPVRSFCEAAWGGLKDGVVKVDSSNRPNGLVRAPILDLDALDRALALLLERHSILNCYIEDRDGAPWLIPGAGARPTVTLLDHSGGSTAADREAAERAIGDLVWTRFDVCEGPLYRAYAVRFGQHEVYIGLVTHHFVSDAVSIDVLMGELGHLYGCAITGKPPSLPPAGLRYQDYLRCMTEWIGSPAGTALRDAAIERLASMPVIDFGDRLDSEGAGEEFFHLDPAVGTKVRATARRLGVSVFTLLLAAQKAVLLPYSPTGRTAIKVITTGREVSLLARTVGNMADRMVVIADLSGATDFADIVARTQASLSWSRKHAFVRDELIQADPRVASGSTAAPVFNFQTVRKRASSAGQPQAALSDRRDLRVPPSGAERTRPRDAYYLVMFDDNENMWGSIRYGPGKISGFLEELEATLCEYCDERSISIPPTSAATV